MKLLKLFGLEKYQNKPYTSLSGGQMQLLLIARALMTNPRYLLLDEPTSHLDMKNAVIVMNTIRKLSERGVGIVMVLHDPNLATLFSDRIAIMKNGRLIETGTPDKILQHEVLERAYDTSFIIVDSPVRIAVPRTV
ncbi:ABC transporter ATP-binding protein [Thermococcus sp.]